jgi:AraC-like DNA-binding protein
MAAYEVFFGCPVEFGTKGYFLELPGEPLRKEMIARQPRVAARLEEVAESYLRAIAPEFETLVRENVRVAIDKRERPTRAYIAKQMGIGERTLGRRLEEEGNSFRTLVDDTRCKLALSMLRADELSVSEIAHVIGFQDSTSFTKAFRRWTGESPSARRERLRDE